MAARSTRTKIKDQGGKMKSDLERLYEHLDYMVELADGRSEYITSYAPLVVGVLKEFEKVLYAFIEGL